jgi:hypothetical protein
MVAGSHPQRTERKANKLTNARRALIADLTNDLATAVKHRNMERVRAQGFMLAVVGNGLELTEERFASHMTDYNSASVAVYRILWALHNNGLGARPGKTPVMKYSAKVRCDTRCTHASGSDCTCSCGAVNHGSFYPGVARYAKDPAAEIARIKKQNAAELKALNADPVRRLLHLFGVRNRQEIVRGLQANRAA